MDAASLCKPRQRLDAWAKARTAGASSSHKYCCLLWQIGSTEEVTPQTGCSHAMMWAAVAAPGPAAASTPVRNCAQSADHSRLHCGTQKPLRGDVYNKSSIRLSSAPQGRLTLISRRMLGMTTLGMGLLMSLMATASPVAFSLNSQVSPVPPRPRNFISSCESFRPKSGWPAGDSSLSPHSAQHQPYCCCHPSSHWDCWRRLPCLGGAAEPPTSASVWHALGRHLGLTDKIDAPRQSSGQQQLLDSRY